MPQSAFLHETLADQKVVESPAQKLVLDILRARLKMDFSLSLCADEKIWQQALSYSRDQRVILFLYEYLKRRPETVPAALMSLMAGMYLGNAVQNQRFASELNAIAKLFAGAGLSFIPLKGLILSRFLYGDPALRPSVDIDLLVRPGDAQRAAGLLQKRGYEPILQTNALLKKVYRKTQHHRSFTYRDRRIFLELHHRYSPRNRAAVVSAAGSWQRAFTLECAEGKFVLLSPEDQLLYLSIHSARECWGSLLQLYDLAALLIQHPPEWNLLCELALEQRCRRRLLISCALVSRLFGIALPERMAAAIDGERTGKQVCEMALDKLFAYQGGKKRFQPEHLWLDPLLADTWRDRLGILYYKGVLRITKAIGGFEANE